MKKLPFAAAALLVGTSAYAMIPSTQPVGTWVQKDPYIVEPTPAVDPVYDEAPALQPAAVETWTTYTADDNASALKTVTETSDEVKAAETEDEPDLAPAVAEVDPASHEATAVNEEPVPADNGVGGPYEAVDTAAADLAPRPAAQNYPACRPGRGDDNCIQLYESGVRQQLAGWTQPTGGFAGSGETQVAMGGPYEPVADSATETERLNQQALADSARALQMAQAAVVTTDEQAVDTAQADEAGTQVAMGGPYEPVADDAAMNGDGAVDTALGETADDEDMAEV